MINAKGQEAGSKEPEVSPAVAGLMDFLRSRQDLNQELIIKERANEKER
jgi:hypothetical protein